MPYASYHYRTSFLLSFFFLILFLFFYFVYLKFIFHDILLITLQHWQVSVAHWLGLRLACERSRVRIKAMSSNLKYTKQHSFFFTKDKILHILTLLYFLCINFMATLCNYTNSILWSPYTFLGLNRWLGNEICLYVYCGCRIYSNIVDDIIN